MKITVRNRDEHELKSGDVVLVKSGGELLKTYLLSDDSDVVQVVNIDTGKIDYSISKHRGFKELLKHIGGFLESLGTIEYEIAQNEEVEIVINRVLERQ